METTIAPADIRFGDGVPTKSHTTGDSFDREFLAGDPHEGDRDMISLAAQRGQPRRERSCRQRRLEGEGFPPCGQIPQMQEHGAPSLQRGALGSEAAQAPRDDIGIDEMPDARATREEDRRERAFSGTVRPSEHQAMRHGRKRRLRLIVGHSPLPLFGLPDSHEYEPRMRRSMGAAHDPSPSDHRRRLTAERRPRPARDGCCGSHRPSFRAASATNRTRAAG